MSITLEEIIHHEERLRQEIVERECVLAALKVMHTYVANGQGPKSLDFGSLFSTLVPAESLTLSTVTVAPAVPASLPAPAPEPPYIHPELRALSARHRTDTQIVAWAIQRMTADYTLNDIARLLEREGCRLRHEQISVVLTRLKNRGEIHEVQRGRGRTGAIFQGPVGTSILGAGASDHPTGVPALVEESAA